MRLLNGCFGFILPLLAMLSVPALAQEAMPQEAAAPAAPQAQQETPGAPAPEPAPAPAPANAPAAEPQNSPEPASTEDIWQEVFFDSAQDFDVNDPRVQQMLEEIKTTDPQKFDRLDALKKEDMRKYVEAIRLEIREALKPKPKPEEAGQVRKGPAEWQQQLQKRHENFLDWYAKEYPADHAELLKIRESDPEQYIQKTMDMMTIYEPIQRAQHYNAELANVMKKDIELQKQRDALLLRIRNAGPDEQPQLLKDLESLVAARFDTIVQKKEFQYESLRRRLERLEQQLDQQALELETLKKNKAQTVEDHIKELMSRSEKIAL